MVFMYNVNDKKASPHLLVLICLLKYRQVERRLIFCIGILYSFHFDADPHPKPTLSKIKIIEKVYRYQIGLQHDCNTILKLFKENA
jgi:hypothetical protein